MFLILNKYLTMTPVLHRFYDAFLDYTQVDWVDCLPFVKHYKN